MHRTRALVKKSYFLNEWHSSRRIDSQRDVTTGFTVAARERRFNPQKLSACTSNSTSLCISCPLSGPPAPARRGARGGAARFKIAENRSQSEDYRHATTPDPTQPNQPDFMPHKSCYVLSSRKLRACGDADMMMRRAFLRGTLSAVTLGTCKAQSTRAGRQNTAARQ